MAAYAFKLSRIERGVWRMRWTVDRRVRHGGRHLRWPTTFVRDTDATGARRFAKKHGLPRV